MINIRVDQTLVKRGIDTSKLTVSSSKGEVLIMGKLVPRSHRDRDTFSKPLTMKMLDKQLRRVPNLKRVIWKLDNWQKEGSQWRHIKGGDSQ